MFFIKLTRKSLQRAETHRLCRNLHRFPQKGNSKSVSKKYLTPRLIPDKTRIVSHGELYAFVFSDS